MANEPSCTETPTKFARYTVADAAIPLHTILQLSGDNTASASSGADVFAGIAWEEKTSGDGIVEIVTAIDGVWDMTVAAGASVTLGAQVVLSGANLIINAAAGDLLIGKVLGKALEAGDPSEVIRVRVGEGI